MFNQSAIERVAENKIAEAAAAGQFDNLRGAGKPIPNLHPGRPDAPDWWVRQWVERESLHHAAKPPRP